jgi:hypothetical protein
VCITVLGNNKVIENPLDGIVLEIKENTITNTGLILMIKNVAPNNYEYGAPYWIEEKINDQWILKTPKTTVWTMEARILSGNSIREEDLDWVYLYGELSPGDYRVSKHFSYSNDKDYKISVEFTIN